MHLHEELKQRAELVMGLECVARFHAEQEGPVVVHRLLVHAPHLHACAHQTPVLTINQRRAIEGTTDSNRSCHQQSEGCQH